MRSKDPMVRRREQIPGPSSHTEIICETSKYEQWECAEAWQIVKFDPIWTMTVWFLKQEPWLTYFILVPVRPVFLLGRRHVEPQVLQHITCPLGPGGIWKAKRLLIVSKIFEGVLRYSKMFQDIGQAEVCIVKMSQTGETHVDKFVSSATFLQGDTVIKNSGMLRTGVSWKKHRDHKLPLLRFAAARSFVYCYGQPSFLALRSVEKGNRPLCLPCTSSACMHLDAGCF